MKNEITIKLPEGYELDSDEPCKILKGEMFCFVGDDFELKVSQASGDKTYLYYRVRSTWKPPASCPNGAVFTKYENIDSWYVSVPFGDFRHSAECPALYSDFTPPPYSPYTVEVT